MIMPAGMTILTRTAGPARVGRVMAIVGVPMLIGPILGGFLVDQVSWRWIFFINLPIGTVAVVASLRVLPVDQPRPTERFGALGLILLSPGLALVIYGLAQSSSHGGFGAPEVFIPILVGLVLLALFVRHGLRSEHTLTVFALAVFPYSRRSRSGLASGLLMAPQGIGAMITMPIAGKLTDRMGVGKIVLPGTLLSIASFVALTQVTATTSYWWLGVVLFVMGLGMGGSMMPVFSGAMQTLRAAVARASTSLNILQQVGASIGTAVMAVVLSSALASRLPAGGGEGLGATAVPDSVRERIAPLMAEAFGETFWWATGFVVIATLVSLLLPRTKPEPIDDPDDPDRAR
jgi:MFS family permease